MSNNQQLDTELNEDAAALRARIAELEQINAEQARTIANLRMDQTHLRALLEHTTDYILICDDEGFPVAFNTAYAAIQKFAQGLEMRPGIKPHTLLPDQAMRDWWDGLHQRVLSGESFKIEFSFPFAEGDIRHFEFSYNPITEKGQVTGFTEISREITAHKRAQQALIETQALLNAVIEQSPVPMAVAATDGTLMLVNEASREHLGISPADNIVPGIKLAEMNKTWQDYDADGTLVALEDLPISLALRGIPTIKREMSVVRADGTECWEYVYGVPIYDDAGNLIAGYIVFPDITPLKEAEKQRLELTIERERVAILRRFLSDISHDLNTPLTTIKTSLYLLPQLTDPTKYEQHLHILNVQTAHLERVLQDMLAASRKDLVLMLNREPVDIAALLQTIINEHAGTIVRKKHTIELTTEPDLKPIQADRRQLRRALNNIIINALLYTPDEGTITLHGYQQYNFTVIDVIDNGMGISADDLPCIFDYFYRADKARSTVQGGAGLGLTTAKQIVEAHRGQIKVSSAPGTGSTFTVVLPNA